MSDLALNAEVKVSSSDSSAETSNPANAVDGLDNTRWGAPKTDSNPWYEINLGQQCRIDSVDLKFERAYPKSFRIQISDDGKTWRDYKTIKDWTEREIQQKLRNRSIMPIWNLETVSIWVM